MKPNEMGVGERWQKELGPRLEGSRPLDSGKLQAPCVVRLPDGGFRMFYTAVGPAKPFATCQGYILSAYSPDGLEFDVEPEIRLAPRTELPHMSLRLIAPTVTRCDDARWRMYFEARGTADQPTVICSAVSDDLLSWRHEEGIRLRSPGGVGGPRFATLPDGRGRLYCFRSEYGPGGPGRGERVSQNVVSAVTSDGLDFEFEPGIRIRGQRTELDQLGVTAAEVVPPTSAGGNWMMLYSAWQDAPSGSIAPTHPSQDANAVENGLSEDFAAASIACDMAGFRSRIFIARSADGLAWTSEGCVIEGDGYEAEGLDAVHAEDMSIARLDGGRFRVYYAACDRKGNWRIASAVSER